MITPGSYHTLTIQEFQSEQVLLNEGIAILKREVPREKKAGDTLEVFVYHDSKNNLMATTTKPKAVVGELATLKVIDMTPAGAFLDWGLPKDLFLPRSFHEDDLQVGDYCLVKLLLDEASGKVLCKETLEGELNNEVLTVIEKEVVNLIVYKDTPLGYQCIINGKHLGLLHYNEVFKDLFVGDKVTGFIKKIKEDHKIDVMIGKPGHTRVEDEASVILNKLAAQNGFLPFHDKSPADTIYKEFGMSKKTFKMTIGNLYREKKIKLEPEGIRLIS
ncbi:MAG: S1-like domain-containing RNA-binding protein [Bacteroidia bacterium]|jgi:hypothetical protein